jgi:cell division protein FtsZ
MIAEGVSGVEYIAINTDAQALSRSRAPMRLQIGGKVTRGLGCGGNPACGERSAQESIDDIKDALRGADMVFVAAGMGGGTGTGGVPIVAQAARQMGALTVSVVTKPFGWEGSYRVKAAMQGIEHLRPNVDTLVVIANDRLAQILPPGTSLRAAFLKADDLLRQGIQGISDLIVHTGQVNVDFNDVRTIMGNGGSALMAVGRGSGETRAMDAVMQAVNSDLLEVSIKGARGVLLNFKGNYDMTLYEVREAADAVAAMVDPEANIIFGADYDEAMGDDIQITVVATGFAEAARLAAPTATMRMTDAAPQQTRDDYADASMTRQQDAAPVPSGPTPVRLPVRPTSNLVDDLPPWIRKQVR